MRGRPQNVLCVFVYSFMPFLQRLIRSTTTQKRSRHSTDSVSEFHAEAPQEIASDGLAQGPYVAARAGFEPTTLRTKGDESTNEPPRPTTSVTTTDSTEASNFVQFHIRFLPVLVIPHTDHNYVGHTRVMSKGTPLERPNRISYPFPYSMQTI